MFIPTKVHIYAQYSTDKSGENWLKIRQEQIAVKANIENALISLAEQLDIMLINLVPVFESLAREGKMLYYPFDTHWNSAGREIAARYVAEVLQDRYSASL